MIATKYPTPADDLERLDGETASVLIESLCFPQGVGIEYEVTKLCGVDPIQQILGAYLATPEGRQNYLSEDVQPTTMQERPFILTHISNTFTQLSANGLIAIVGSQANGFSHPSPPSNSYNPTLHDLDIMYFDNVNTQDWKLLEPKSSWHRTLISRGESVFSQRINPSDDRGCVLISYDGGTSLKLKWQPRKKMRADFNPHILTDLCEIGFATNHQTANGQEINLTPLHFDPAQKTILVFSDGVWYKIDRQPEVFSDEYLQWLSETVPASLLAKMYLRQIEKACRAKSITAISEAIVNFKEVSSKTGLDLGLASAYPISNYAHFSDSEIDNTYALWSFFHVVRSVLSYKPNIQELAQFNLANPNSEIWWLLDNWLPAVADWLRSKKIKSQNASQFSPSTRSILNIMGSLLASDEFREEAHEQHRNRWIANFCDHLLLPSTNLAAAWKKAQTQQDSTD